jgi:hypothetical protein
MIFDIVDECFTVQLNDPSKTEKADKLIDEAADFQDAVLVRINGAKTKEDFRPILELIENAQVDFINKLNGLN